MQQPGSSQDKVLNEFKEDTNSVLLGTGAYWEGISIEGKSLSNVIIFRLPFPVPDPIIEYKCSVAKDALMDVRVPEMIIKLKQGIGRLIRNFTDIGIVCIIDRRLRDEPPERYHDITWDSLPIKNRASSLDELRKFYEGLPSAKEAVQCVFTIGKYFTVFTTLDSEVEFLLYSRVTSRETGLITMIVLPFLWAYLTVFPVPLGHPFHTARI